MRDSHRNITVEGMPRSWPDFPAPGKYAGAYSVFPGASSEAQTNRSPEELWQPHMQHKQYPALLAL